MRSAPILFTIFNRPDLTEKVFRQIRKVRPNRIYIAADGPRDGNPNDRGLCQMARKVTEEIDWECECKRLYRESNKGCKAAMVEAIDWFFSHEEEGIIVEDDCFFDVGFIDFCAKMLDHYREDERVYVISGSNLANYRGFICSYEFSRYPHIWGWATWKRAWDGYSASIEDWSGCFSGFKCPPISQSAQKYWSTCFDYVKSGKVDTWDYQLAFKCLKEGGLCIHPCVNMVENVGFDARATHTKKKGKFSNIPATGLLPIFLRHPSNVGSNENLDLVIERKLYRPKSLLRYVVRKIACWWRSFGLS